MPSRKIIIPLILATLLGGGWWFFADNQNQLPAENKITKTNNDTWDTLSSDSDNDGLKDWEELLWKTDPKNPDTDSDGTTDDAEIADNRDPRKAGPDDKITAVPTADDAGTITGTHTESNLTAGLAEDFINSYFIRKIASASQGNAPIDTDSLENQIFTNMVSTIVKEDAIDRAPRYQEKDFKSAPGTSSASTRAYINALGALFRDAVFPEKNEMEIISEITSSQGQNTESQNLESLKELPAHTKAYQKLAEDMKTIPVPRDLLEVHVRMANNFWRLGAYLEVLSTLQTDPVKGVMALVGYSQESAQAQELLKVITSEIKEQNFVFSAKEGGSEFNAHTNI
ncbi:MAG: hypothetical protein A3J54_04515 [Candidatus Ryanbacteria bacterium RIFCSPHIGHO2_02_FULL_45_13b]|uniref:Thrombospondin type 3 repeat superfamily protein n=1 Tax=Candidatus Ryanbacteria bacterium RIFCSPHIGHO2_02_FULL_45_13b TaxID=1802117 RepID=A0A1G2G5C1_9BACT|nr:MAG: hypothetical protein A3J54_04515 [Candidatus Ryanbacteria bacterium RIFCSPHIGHO2_02_FULL_45_13b]